MKPGKELERISRGGAGFYLYLFGEMDDPLLILIALQNSRMPPGKCLIPLMK